MTEWRQILSYEGYYEVSDDGQVRGLDRPIFAHTGRLVRMQKGVVLKPTPHPRDGHLYVLLSDRRGRRRRAVHHLVLENFVGPRPHGLWGLHQDGNEVNNHASNLYWGTPSQNMQDTLRHGHHAFVNKTHCKRGHEFTPENTRLRNGPGHNRICIACVTIRNAARYWEKALV